MEPQGLCLKCSQLDHLAKACRKVKEPYISRRDVNHNMTDKQVTMEGFDCPQPIVRYGHAPLVKQVMDTINPAAETSNIEGCLLPSILFGYDIICEAESGSRKKRGTLIAILSELMRVPRNDIHDHACHPQALILEPTRELVHQIKQQALELSQDHRLKVIGIHGGYSRSRQLQELEGTDILISTIGRLMDFVNSGNIHLNCIRNFVLHEAEELLSESFYDDVIGLVEHPEIPSSLQKQTVLMFSFRMHPIQTRFRNSMRNIILIKKVETFLTYIAHNVVEISDHKKKDYLLNVLDDIFIKDTTSFANHMLMSDADQIPTSSLDRRPHKVLIFARTKYKAFEIYESIEKTFSSTILNSRVCQRKGDDQLKRFKSGEVEVLVATSLAARGLHIRGLDLVINYDTPCYQSEYLHRASRLDITGQSHVAGIKENSCAPFSQSLHLSTDGRVRCITLFVKKQDSGMKTYLDEIISQMSQAAVMPLFDEQLVNNPLIDDPPIDNS